MFFILLNITKNEVSFSGDLYRVTFMGYYILLNSEDCTSGSFLVFQGIQLGLDGDSVRSNTKVIGEDILDHIGTVLGQGKIPGF